MTVVQAFYGELGWLWGMRGCELSRCGGCCIRSRWHWFECGALMLMVWRPMSILENSIYHVELRKALSLIHEHKYQGALDYLKDKGEGIFKNGDVSINNAIREYCINQLS